MPYDRIPTIRYMGNKSGLLDRIVPVIRASTPKNGTVCDLMAGTHSVAYALKRDYRIITNDVQVYSYVIGAALIENQGESISAEDALIELWPAMEENQDQGHYRFFADHYPDTYFSARQCASIDALRYAIDQLADVTRRNLYLCALMGAMCLVQSTPGHFAQFMPADHRRIQMLRGMDLGEAFLQRADAYHDIVFSGHDNRCHCDDAAALIASGALDQIDTLYLDSPYNQEQYSRFYHVLETVCRYDSPRLTHKARYRENRFKSDFSSKKTVRSAFEGIVRFCAARDICLIISYSDRGLLALPELETLCHEFFRTVDTVRIPHAHSSQGRGLRPINEIVMRCQGAR